MIDFRYNATYFEIVREFSPWLFRSCQFVIFFQTNSSAFKTSLPLFCFITVRWLCVVDIIFLRKKPPLIYLLNNITNDIIISTCITSLYNDMKIRIFVDLEQTRYFYFLVLVWQCWRTRWSLQWLEDICTMTLLF